MKSRFKRGYYILTILFFIVFIISLILDNVLVKFIESIRNPYFDSIFIAFTLSTNVFIIFFFLTTIFLWKEHKSRWVFPLLFSYIAVGILSFLLKILIARPRPFQVGVVSVFYAAFYFLKDSFNTWNYSFPSFEAISVFAALPILIKEFRVFRHIWLVFAIIVALSRVYFGVHYFSDVIAGAGLGYLVGSIFVYLEEKYNYGKRLSKKFHMNTKNTE